MVRFILMARIVVNATGFSGNFYPFLTLAKALRQRGHAVTVATGSHYYKEQIENEGLEFYPLSEFLLPSKFDADPNLKNKILYSKGNLKLLLKYRVLPNLQNSFEELNAVCSGADLLISGVLPFAASLVHEKRKIKWISFCIHPPLFFSKDEIWPPKLWMAKIPLQFRRVFTLLSHVILRKQVDHWSKDWHQLRKNLGLIGTKNMLLDSIHSPMLQLAAFSKFIWPRQSDWPDHRKHVGFIRSPFVEMDLSTELKAFLAAGESPFVFTMGGAASIFFGNQFFNMCLTIIQKQQIRAVFCCGEMEVTQELRERVDKVPWVILTGKEPFSKLFPYARAVIQHGGVGTIGEAIIAGSPMLIVPGNAENPSNGLRISFLKCGVCSGSKPISPRIFEKLLLKINQKQFRDSAQLLSAKVRTENGVEDSIFLIEEHLRK